MKARLGCPPGGGGGPSTGAGCSVGLSRRTSRSRSSPTSVVVSSVSRRTGVSPVASSSNSGRPRQELWRRRCAGDRGRRRRPRRPPESPARRPRPRSGAVRDAPGEVGHDRRSPARGRPGDDPRERLHRRRPREDGDPGQRRAQQPRGGARGHLHVAAQTPRGSRTTEPSERSRDPSPLPCVVPFHGASRSLLAGLPSERYRGAI